MMDRKVIVYIGISLDGYIATREESLDWLLDTPGEGDNGFGAFYDTIDTIIMGRKTYDWIMKHDGRFPYEGKKCFVYTREDLPDTEHVHFVSQPIEELIAEQKQEGDKYIWIVGGSQIIDMVRKSGLIDEYIINIAPVIVGDGIPLFYPGEQADLELVRTQRFGQFIELSYRTKQ